MNDDGKTLVLNRHDQTRVRKYIKIKADASIYNGDLVYFSKRLSLTNPRIESLRNLIRKQRYSCANCNLKMVPGEVIELHHVKDEQNRRTGDIRFVHGHCQDSIHSTK